MSLKEMGKGINRRDFIKLCGIGTAALAAPATLVPLAEGATGPVGTDRRG